MRRILLATVALLGIAASASARAGTYQLTGTVFSDALTAYISTPVLQRCRPSTSMSGR